MKKYFITLCTYPKGDKVRNLYELHTKPRFIEYCKIHGFDFYEIKKNLKPSYNLWFSKMLWIQQNMSKFNDGDIITYMDVDCVIMDARQPYIFDKDFSIVQESTGVICMGTWSLRICDWSRKFVNDFCSEAVQETIRESKFWSYWQDNAAIYIVLGIAWGNNWNMLSDELKEHVAFLDAKWGCTFQKDDTDLTKRLPFNKRRDSNATYKTIAKFVQKERECEFDDIIVRHLSADTKHLPWASRYFNTKMKV